VADLIDLARDSTLLTVWNLRRRFCGDPDHGLPPTPYTACGEWLLAINPQDGTTSSDPPDAPGR
jgi:hypothetical protein